MAPYREIARSLRQLYLDDKRPWLVGFSGGKDSTMLASLVFDAILSIPPEQRKKEVSVVCTDTRVEIPAIAEMIEGTLDRMRKFSQQNGMSVSAYLLKPIYEESFWVNIIGRGYPPPDPTFRWCTQRMKIDPVNDFVKQRIRRMVTKVGEYSESRRAHGLPDDLLHILKDDVGREDSVRPEN